MYENPALYVVSGEYALVYDLYTEKCTFVYLHS